MKIPECHREQEVLDALRSGRWSGAWGDDIREHVAHCGVCAEVALVAEALGREALLDHSEVRLPSAGLVWWKAQRAARRAAEERAAQPIALVERIAQAFGLLTALGFALWQWPRIAGWLGGVKNVAPGPGRLADAGAWMDRLFQSFAQGFGGQSSGFLVIASVGALITLMAFAAYVVWREE